MRGKRRDAQYTQHNVLYCNSLRIRDTYYSTQVQYTVRNRVQSTKAERHRMTGRATRRDRTGTRRAARNRLFASHRVARTRLRAAERIRERSARRALLAPVETSGDWRAIARHEYRTITHSQPRSRTDRHAVGTYLRHRHVIALCLVSTRRTTAQHRGQNTRLGL